MKSTNQLTPEIELSFLRAYLYKTFSLENRCEDDFERTVRYLGERYSDEEVDLIIDYFKEIGIKSDCDILHKLEVDKNKVLT